MLNNTGNQDLENLSISTQVSGNQKQLLVQKYLQRPFSIFLSKLAFLFRANQALSQPEVIETNQPQQCKPNSINEQDLYPYFLDRVDPSLYYTIFFSPMS